MRLYPRKLFEDGTRRVAEAGALLPHLKTFPQHEGEEANENMGLNTVFSLVPNRTHVQLILLDPKGGLGLSELNVGLPELFVAPIVDIRPQEVGALGELGPGIERRVVGNTEADTCGAAIRLQRNDEAGGGTLVALENAADLPVQLRRIEPFLRARDAGSQTFECRLDPLTEPVMDCPLFAAPIRRPTEDHGLRSPRMVGELDLDALMHGAPAIGISEFRAKLLQLRLRRSDDVAPAGLA